MKILKYIFLVLVVLVMLFFAMGLLYPTVKYGHTVTVNKPIHEAWAVAQDTSKAAQWIEGLKSHELLNGDRGEEGSTYLVVVNPGQGQDDFTMMETIISKKDFDHISMHFDSDIMEFDQTMTFAEQGGQTTITTVSTVDGKGTVMHSMFATMEVLGSSFKKQEQKNLGNLKKIIEANTTDYYAKDTVGKK